MSSSYFICCPPRHIYSSLPHLENYSRIVLYLVEAIHTVYSCIGIPRYTFFSFPKQGCSVSRGKKPHTKYPKLLLFYLELTTVHMLVNIDTEKIFSKTNFAHFLFHNNFVINFLVRAICTFFLICFFSFKTWFYHCRTDRIKTSTYL